jgi:hypothetical protein
MDDGDAERRARDEVVEDFLLRGMCSRDEAETEAARLLAPMAIAPAISDGSTRSGWPEPPDHRPPEGPASSAGLASSEMADAPTARGAQDDPGSGMS